MSSDGTESSSRLDGDGLREAVGCEPRERLVERAVGEQQQLPLGQPAVIARRIDGGDLDAADLRRFAQPLDPGVDLVGVVVDRLTVGRREDDEELIEVAECREKRPERRDDASVLRQQRQHVGVEGQAARRPQPRREGKTQDAGDDERAATVRRWTTERTRLVRLT